MSNDTNPVVQLAKERKRSATPDAFEVDGVVICMVGVPSGAIQDARAKVKPPPVPTWYNPDKDREEENPNDPGYLQALEDLNERRATAAAEALVMFGLEIEQDTWPPSSDAWLKRLKLADRRGLLDLFWVDWDDEIDQQFLFLKYRVMTNERYMQLSSMAGLSQEAMAEAIASFRRAQARSSNSSGSTEE